MLSDFRFSRGGVFGQVLGISGLIALLFVAGCGGGNSNKSTPSPVLTITKTHTGSFTQGQQNATYTVTVSNTGNAATSGTVTVTETVPSGLTLVSMAGTGWTCTTNTCTRADALAASSSYPTITVTVNVSASATSPQANQVSVSGGGAATANGQDSTTIIVLAPALTISKTHTGNFQQGQAGASYTVTVSNAVSATAPTSGTVTVTETVPSGLTLVSMAGTGWTCTTNTCTRADALAAGSSYANITVLVNVAANASTPQVNQVSASGGGSATANASDSTIIDEPVLSISKTHTGNFSQGQTGATYTVTVMNTGTLSTTAGTVTVADTVPSGETLVSMTGGTGWTCPGLGGANTCDNPNVLAAGASYSNITVTVNVAANASSPLVNQVTVSGGGSATGNGSDSTTINGADPCASAGTGSESLLNGQYDLLLKGFDNGLGTGETVPEPALIGGVLAFNGTNNGGLITSGAIDMNLNSGVQSNLAVTAGSYKVGSDHRACITITTSAGTQHYRGSLGNIASNVASTGHIIGFDTAGPFTAGILRKSGTIPTTLSGTFAFGISSAQNTANITNGVAGGKFGAAGVVTFSNSGAFTVSEDFNQNGQLDGSSANTTWPSTPISFSGGVYTISTNGRGTITFTPTGSSNPVHAVIYVVSSSEILILGSDAQVGNSAFAGTALQQSGSFSNSSVSGTDVIYLSSLHVNSPNPSTSETLIGTVNIPSAGNFNFFAWDNSSGTVSQQGPQSGTYSVDSTGRMLLTGSSGGNHPPLFYLVSANKAFVLGSGGGVESGMFEPQTSTASPNTTFAFGTIDPQDANVSDNEGVATFSTATTPNPITGTSDNNSSGSQQAGSAISDTYSTDSTGLVTSPSGCTIGTGTTPCKMIFYVISPMRAVGMSVKSTDTNPGLFIADQ